MGHFKMNDFSELFFLVWISLIIPTWVNYTVMLGEWGGHKLQLIILSPNTLFKVFRECLVVCIVAESYWKCPSWKTAEVSASHLTQNCFCIKHRATNPPCTQHAPNTNFYNNNTDMSSWSIMAWNFVYKVWIFCTPVAVILCVHIYIQTKQNQVTNE
jgi:hypothetical protein